MRATTFFPPPASAHLMFIRTDAKSPSSLSPRCVVFLLFSSETPFFQPHRRMASNLGGGFWVARGFLGGAGGLFPKTRPFLLVRRCFRPVFLVSPQGIGAFPSRFGGGWWRLIGSGALVSCSWRSAGPPPLCGGCIKKPRPCCFLRRGPRVLVSLSGCCEERGACLYRGMVSFPWCSGA